MSNNCEPLTQSKAHKNNVCTFHYFLDAALIVLFTVYGVAPRGVPHGVSNVLESRKGGFGIGGIYDGTIVAIQGFQVIAKWSDNLG